MPKTVDTDHNTGVKDNQLAHIAATLSVFPLLALGISYYVVLSSIDECRGSMPHQFAVGLCFLALVFAGLMLNSVAFCVVLAGIWEISRTWLLRILVLWLLWAAGALFLPHCSILLERIM